MRPIDPKTLTTPELHGLLLGAISPRPIAFASTVDKNGLVNLSPFSFFNVFSANPPIMVFSPARRVRGNTTKHTLDNAHATKEVVISVVNYDMVQQMSLASSEYEQGIDEFVKSGFTPEPSTKVRPPRVKESPVSFECKVNDIIPLGDKGGAGNLIICEVVFIHLDEQILGSDDKIDPYKLDALPRLGKDWYSRVQGVSIFEITKTSAAICIGYDQIPTAIKESNFLSGNELGQLATIESLPGQQEISRIKQQRDVATILGTDSLNQKQKQERLVDLAKIHLSAGQTQTAWCILMAAY